MIDFENKSFLKLKSTDPKNVWKDIEPLLIPGEELIEAFKSVRDAVAFTNKRIISINTQGVTGKKRAFTVLPYSKIQAYAIETSGVFDLDSELVLWYSSLGQIRFEFTASSKMKDICRIISQHLL